MPGAQIEKRIGEVNAAEIGFEGVVPWIRGTYRSADRGLKVQTF